MKRKARKFSHSHHGTMHELNITPLLDLAFVLLVIFIITTPQLMNNLELNLPSGQPAPPVGPRPQINQITVNGLGQILLNEQTVTLPELKTRLAAFRASDPETSVVVRGAAEADYQKVVDVLDVIQQVDITKLGLATDTADTTGPSP